MSGMACTRTRCTASLVPHTLLQRTLLLHGLVRVLGRHGRQRRWQRCTRGDRSFMQRGWRLEVFSQNTVAFRIQQEHFLSIRLTTHLLALYTA